jgi:lipopolysaccharide biosynthesis glycosyltransferase
MIGKKALFLFALWCHPVLGETSSDLLARAGASTDQKLEALCTLVKAGATSPLADLARQALQDKNPDALYELAYASKGFSQYIKFDKALAVNLLNDRVKQGDVFADGLAKFIQKRSIEKAEELLKLAQSSRQRALAFLCMAEVSFAKRQLPKTMLYSVLSLATYPSEIHDEQVQFYLEKAVGQRISLMRDKEALLDSLNAAMSKEKNPEKYRLLFDMASVVGLLSSYPLDFQLKPKNLEPKQIFLGFDDNYAIHGGITIFSAILSADPNTSYEINVIEVDNTPISKEHKAALEKLVTLFGDDRFTLNFVPVSDSLLPRILAETKEWPIDDVGQKRGKYWPTVVFYKLLIPQLAGDTKRSLWLDADIIVRSDLGPLFDKDMKGAWFLGTRDRCGSRLLKNIGSNTNNKYLNVGVLLIDNEKFRSEKGIDILNKTLIGQPDLAYLLILPEQDLISLLYQDQTTEVGAQEMMSKEDNTPNSQWNWIAQKHPSTHWSQIHNHFANIIHMEGNDIKPWAFGRRWKGWIKDPKSNNGIQNLYWALRDMGPWPVSYTKRD